jgi:glycine betaine/choline ABC-type transport system substrate-binding protein
MFNSSYIRRVGACATLLAALGLASCKSDSNSTSNTSIAQTITVIAENTPQSHLLSEIYGQALEKAGFRVARRDDVADLPAGYAALKNGAADLFITHTAELLAYTGANEPAAASTSTTAAPTTTEAVTTIASETTEPAPTTTEVVVGPVAPTTTGDGTSTTEVVATTIPVVVGQAAAESINGQTKLIGEILPDALQIGAASDAEDKSVIACNNAVATTGYLKTLSDLARSAKDLRIAGPADFKTGQPFGLPGFEKVYGATFKEFIPVDPAKVGDEITSPTTTPPTTDASASTTSTPDTAAAATTTTQPPLPSDADCGAFNSLDPSMPQDAVEMDDNLNWIQANGVVPLVTTTAFTPGVSQLLDQVSQTLKTVDLRVMLGKVANDGISPAAMAAQYITAAGLTGNGS